MQHLLNICGWRLHLSVYNYIHRVEITFVSIQLHTPGGDYISQYLITYTGWRLHLTVFNYIHRVEITFVSIQLHTPGGDYICQCTITYTRWRFHLPVHNYIHRVTSKVFRWRTLQQRRQHPQRVGRAPQEASFLSRFAPAAKCRKAFVNDGSDDIILHSRQLRQLVGHLFHLRSSRSAPVCR